MLLELTRFIFKVIGIRGAFTLARNIRPLLRIFAINLNPFFNVTFRVRKNRLHRAFGLANTAIDTFVRVDDQHVLADVETIDRADLDAIHIFALDTVLVDDVRHVVFSLGPYVYASRNLSLDKFNVLKSQAFARLFACRAAFLISDIQKSGNLTQEACFKIMKFTVRIGDLPKHL